MLLRPKHTWRCASCVKNGTNASTVYCAHLVIFTSVRNVIAEKWKQVMIFCLWCSISGIYCVIYCVVVWAIYHAKCAYTAQKIHKLWCTPLDVIRPLASLTVFEAANCVCDCAFAEAGALETKRQCSWHILLYELDSIPAAAAMSVNSIANNNKQKPK